MCLPQNCCWQYGWISLISTCVNLFNHVSSFFHQFLHVFTDFVELNFQQFWAILSLASWTFFKPHGRRPARGARLRAHVFDPGVGTLQRTCNLQVHLGVSINGGLHGLIWNIHGMIGIINMIGITKLGSLLNQTINMFCLGGSINEGTPIAGWFIVDNPIYKWMTEMRMPWFRLGRSVLLPTSPSLDTVLHSQKKPSWLGLVLVEKSPMLVQFLLRCYS